MAPRLAAAAWLLWLWGVPALAAGFFVGAIPLLTAGALALEAAVLIGGLQAIRVARHAFDRSRRLSSVHAGPEHRRAAARQPRVQAARS